MGRATITGGGTDGLYTVSLDYGDAERDALVITLQARVATLESAISTLDATITGYDSDLLTKLSQLDSAIATYNASEKTQEDKETLGAISVEAEALRKTRARAANERARLTIELGNTNTRIANLNAHTLTESRPAWCVDYTQLGSGEVATIEVNGETDAILIGPGASPATSSDGHMTHSAVMSSAQLYYDMAVLPGWQKYLPTYRAGTITALDVEANTCSVDLDAALSREQSLDINQASPLTDVPVVYMSCHAAVFSVDDRVIVQFNGQDWSDPTVIGFESNPAPCAAKRIYAVITAFTSTSFPGGSELYYFKEYNESAYIESPDNIFTRTTSFVGADAYPNNPGGTTALSLPTSYSQQQFRVRFDGCYYQDTGTDEYFRYKTGGYTLQTYGSTIDIDSIAPTGTGAQVITSAEQFRIFTEDYTVGPDVPLTADPDLLYHTATGSKTDTQIRLGVDSPDPVPHDRAAIQALIETYWEALPSPIYVDIGGEWIEYVLESVGPRPDRFADWAQTLTITKLSDDPGYPGSYTFDGPAETMGAIYRQVDYSADE